MVRRARKNRANLQNHYSILVQYVNDYFKWFVCCGIANRRFKLGLRTAKEVCDGGRGGAVVKRLGARGRCAA